MAWMEAGQHLGEEMIICTIKNLTPDQICGNVSTSVYPLLLAKPAPVTVAAANQCTLCFLRVGVWFPYEAQDVTNTTHTHKAEDNKRPQKAPACSGVCWGCERRGWECLLLYRMYSIKPLFLFSYGLDHSFARCFLTKQRIFHISFFFNARQDSIETFIFE